MIGLSTMLIKELREQWRTRRLLVVAVVFLAFGIASPLLAVCAKCGSLIDRPEAGRIKFC